MKRFVICGQPLLISTMPFGEDGPINIVKYSQLQIINLFSTSENMFVFDTFDDAKKYATAKNYEKEIIGDPEYWQHLVYEVELSEDISLDSYDPIVETHATGYFDSSRLDGILTRSKDKLSYLFPPYRLIDSKHAIPLSATDVRGKKYDFFSEIYEKLIKLTNRYLDKSNGDPLKRLMIEQLKSHLEIHEKSTKYQCILAFKNALKTIDNHLVKHHRTVAWERYLYNVFSLLTVIPGLIRAYNSFSQYGTLQFWKPTSQQSIECMVEVTKKVNPVPPFLMA